MGNVTSSLLTEIPRYGKGWRHLCCQGLQGRRRRWRRHCWQRFQGMGKDDVVTSDRDSKVWGRMTSSLLTEIPRYGKGWRHHYWQVFQGVGKYDFFPADREFKLGEIVTSSLLTEIPRYGKRWRHLFWQGFQGRWRRWHHFADWDCKVTSAGIKGIPNYTYCMLCYFFYLWRRFQGVGDCEYQTCKNHTLVYICCLYNSKYELELLHEIKPN
jgi:hypothetical protein